MESEKNIDPPEPIVIEDNKGNELVCNNNKDAGKKKNKRDAKFGKEDKENEKEPKKSNDTISSSFTFVSTMCGASLLSNPYTFSALGYFFAVIAFLISVTLSAVFQLSVAKATYYLNAKTFRDVIQAVSGKGFAYTIDILNIFIGIGFMTSYIVIAGSFIDSAIKVFSNGTVEFSIIAIRGIITVFPLIVLSLVKNISILGKISSFAIIAVAITFISSIVYFFMAVGSDGYICINKSTDVGVNGKIAVYDSEQVNRMMLPSGMEWWFFINAIPLIQSNYSVHMVLPNLYSELKGPDRIKHHVVRRAVIYAILLITIVYMIMGMLVSSLFGKNTSDNFLMSYSPCNDYYITVLMLIYCFILFIAYPLQLYPIRMSIMTMAKLSVSTKKGYAIFCVMGILMSGLAYLLSVVLENIVTIFGLISSLFGGFLYFIIPILIMYKMPLIKCKSDVDKRPLEVDSNGQIVVDPVSVAFGTIFVTNGDHRGSINRLRSLSKAPAIAEIPEPGDKPLPSRKMSLIPGITPRKYSVVIGNTVEETKNIIREGRLSIVQARPYNKKDIGAMIDIVDNDEEGKETGETKLDIVARRLSLSVNPNGKQNTLLLPNELNDNEKSGNENLLVTERGNSLTIRVRTASLSNAKELNTLVNTIGHDRKLSNILSQHVNNSANIEEIEAQDNLQPMDDKSVNLDSDHVPKNVIEDVVSPNSENISSYSYTYSYSEEDNAEENEEPIHHEKMHRKRVEKFVELDGESKSEILEHGDNNENLNEGSDDILDQKNPESAIRSSNTQHRKMSIFSRNNILQELSNIVPDIPTSTKVFTNNSVRIPEFEPEIINREEEGQKMKKKSRKAGMAIGLILLVSICLVSFAYSIYSLVKKEN